MWDSLSEIDEVEDNLTQEQISFYDIQGNMLLSDSLDSNDLHKLTLLSDPIQFKQTLEGYILSVEQSIRDRAGN